MDLFSGQSRQYELFDEMRMRVIKSFSTGKYVEADLTEAEAEKSNEHFKNSRCPHLQWRVRQTRKFVIRR